MTDVVSVISLLGSTGSIGTQVLDVARRFPERFRVAALGAGRNLSRLAEQILEFQPEQVAVQRPEDVAELARLVPGYAGKILAGKEGLNALAEWPGVDTVIMGLVGLCGLEPSLRALQSGRKLLTANKETFVAGGHLVQPYLGQVVPIDSEHVAVHQCLGSQPVSAVRNIWLTASGGPFRTWDADAMRGVTREQALKHPNWVMGSKITIDSATLMNKGLEVIEAHWLFGVPYARIKVVIHPESIIHGGVEFKDGSIMVQMGAPDMHGPIQYAMSWPERLPSEAPGVRLDLLGLSRLNLEKPDLERFPCLRLAYEAGALGGGATAVLNGADEMAVQLFLEEKIAYADIARLLENVLAAYTRENFSPAPTLEEIQSLDAWARRQVLELASRGIPTAV